MDHTFYMSRALELAREALDHGEVPVGCVIVWADGRIVGEGRNRREENGDALGHAELEAISMACKTLGGWRLQKATLYVTVEPCAMCAGAILNARIPEIRFGVREEKTGACGSVLNLFEENFGHKPRIYRGLMEQECLALMREFFTKRRESENI